MTADLDKPAAEEPQLLTAEDILSASDITYEDVSVPEWGGLIRIRGLSGFERDRFEAETYSTKGKAVTANLLNLRARLVALCAIDETGRRIFKTDQVKKLGAKNAAALDRAFAVAQRLSGLGDEDVQVLLGNFEPGQNGSSPSD